jgi:uridine phosphorylase
MSDNRKIILDGKILSVDEIYQEHVCHMACEISDIVENKLKDMGMMTADMENALGNEVYDEIMGFFEKMFNFPEYRNHN